MSTLLLNLPVGPGLLQFWETWAALGTSPKVIRIQGGLHHPLSEMPPSTKSVCHHKWLCTSPQTQLPIGGITYPNAKATNKNDQNSNISDFLQPTFLVSQTQKQVETYPRSELTEQISEVRKIYNGDTREYKDLPSGRRMGNIQRLFVSKVNPTISKLHHSASHGVHSVSEGGQTAVSKQV